MPHTRTTVQTVYQFNELSDAAKEKARDWYRDNPFDFEFDCETEEFATIAEIIGIDLDTHEVTLMGGKTRSEPNIYWSVGYTQSDFASFEGTYDYNAMAIVKLREINNDDKWPPIRIATELARIQADNAFGLRAVIKGDEYPSVDVVDRRNEDRNVAEEGEIRQLMKDLASYLYDQLRTQSDYLYSAEHIDEMMEANEYEFDEEGERV